jgi:anti-sigma factor RsiW
MSSTEAESLSCQELVELVTDYLEGALSSEEHARFEAHLDECVNCVTYLEQMRSTIRLTGTLRSEDLDPHAEQAMLAAFQAWKSS